MFRIIVEALRRYPHEIPDNFTEEAAKLLAEYFIVTRFPSPEYVARQWQINWGLAHHLCNAVRESRR